MKKLFVIIFLINICLCAGAQWTPAINEYHYRTGTVCFRGEFVNVPADKYPPHILLIIEDNFTRTEENVLVTVNNDGSFNSDVHIPHSATVYLRADGYENSLPNDLYFFVGDTITLTVDAAAHKTAIAPGSIAYWVDHCRDIHLKRYNESLYGDLSSWYEVGRKGNRDDVEKFCRNLGKVMEHTITDIEKGEFLLPADIHPIAADIIKINAIFTGLYHILDIRSVYNKRKYAPHFDEASGRTIPKAVDGFEPLDDKWMLKFLKKHEDLLFDNPLAAFYEYASVLINRVEYELWYFDFSDIILPVTGGTPQNIEDYAFEFVLPAEYDKQFLDTALPMRADTLLTINDAFSYAIERCKKNTGLQCTGFMMQWQIMRRLFSFSIKNQQANPNVVAEYVAEAMPFLSNPIVAHHYTKAYREYVKKYETAAAGENITDDPVLQKIISPYKGNVLFLDFWNMGCGPCRATMMEQRNFIKDMQGQPVKFLYITEDKYREASEEWLSKTYIEGEHIYISSKDWEYLQAKLRFIGIPFSCIIDMNGMLHRNMNHTMVIEYFNK